MSEVQVFQFKPALMRAPQEWVLDGDDLRGPHGSFDLTKVTETSLTEMRIRGSKIRRLELVHPGGRLLVSISARLTSPHMHAFADLAGAVLARLATRDAELPLYFGERGAPRMVMFLIGLATAAFSVVVGVSGLAGGAGNSQEVLVGIGIMTLFGLWIVIRYWPFGATPMVTVGEAPAVVNALKG